MVHTTNIAASATASTNPPTAATRPSFPQSRRSRTSGSFHAGEPFPLPSSYNDSLPSSSRPRRRSAVEARRLLRRQSTAKYHTFPTPPPAAPSDRLRSPRQPRPWYKRLFGQRDETSDFEDEQNGRDGTSATAGEDRSRKRGRRSPVTSDEERSSSSHTTPLPWGQLGLLALLSLSEQTALNSIGPYLPTMVASFDEIPDGQEGVYVGLLASAFALAQLTTNLLWGYFSDRIGRKPTMLLGTSLLVVCFVFFGLCTTYVQLIMVHVAMGLLNGNAAIVPTCLGEITDRTNQSSAFTWLPVIYSLGSIIGPALGGLLVGVAGGPKYPFLVPNVLAAALLLSSVVVLAIWFEETLDCIDHSAAGPCVEWMKKARDWCLACCGRSGGNARGKGAQVPGQSQGGHDRFVAGLDEHHEASDQSEDEQQGLLESQASGDDEDSDSKKDIDEQPSAFHGLRNRNTLAVLGTYLVFQLSNISFNSLYPIFASSPPPTGRDLGPGTIGVSMSLAGLATILFQLFIFQRLKERMGNLRTYRYSLLGMAISMALMPWVGYIDKKEMGSGKAWLYAELGFTLVLKNICAVGGLSSVMLLITNSAPSHETLGTLNGIAQTLSAAGRSIGPFLAGGLFTLSTRVRPKGEALAWGLFAGIALLGWVASFIIRSKGLESADFPDDEDSDDEANTSEDEEHHVGI